MHQTKFVYINEANPTCFLGFSPILLKIGFKWVGLALRIQKWVQLGRIGIKKMFKFEFLGLNLFTFILLCVILVLNFQNNERNISLLRQICFWGFLTFFPIHASTLLLKITLYTDESLSKGSILFLQLNNQAEIYTITVLGRPGAVHIE